MSATEHLCIITSPWYILDPGFMAQGLGDEFPEGGEILSGDEVFHPPITQARRVVVTAGPDQDDARRNTWQKRAARNIEPAILVGHAERWSIQTKPARPVALLPTLTYGFYPAFLDFTKQSLTELAGSGHTYTVRGMVWHQGRATRA